MKANNDGWLIAAFASLLGGAAIAWTEYQANNKVRESRRTLVERFKQAESKLYLDGMQRANDIEEIKREVDKQITN